MATSVPAYMELMSRTLAARLVEFACGVDPHGAMDCAPDYGEEQIACDLLEGKAQIYLDYIREHDEGCLEAVGQEYPALAARLADDILGCWWVNAA